MVDNLFIETGIDHAVSSSTFYPQGAGDQYWTLVAAPSPYNAPMCAISQGQWGSHFQNGISTGLSATFTGLCSGNMVGNQNNCNFNASRYIFERGFCVNTGPNNLTVYANLNIMKLYVDLNLEEIRLIGPNTPPAGVILVPGCFSQGSYTFTGINFGFVTGQYRLQFRVGNDWDNIGSVFFPDWSGPTAMFLEVQGFINAATPIFVDNKHYGKNTALCAPAYPQFPAPVIQGNTCVPTANATAQFTVSPYNAAPFNSSPYSLSISPSITHNNGVFTAGVGTYTISAGDGTGCLQTTVLNVTVAPTLTLTPSVQCHDFSQVGSFASVICSSSSPNLAAYPYQCLNPPPFSLASNILNTPTAGIYTLQVTDAVGCTGTNTAVIGHAFQTTISTVPSPPCLQPGGVVTISTSTNYPISPIFYTINGLLFGGVATVNNPGPYIVQGTDAYGCTANSAISVAVAPVVSLILSSNVPCVYDGGAAIITAQGGAGMAYQLNGVTQPSNQFTVTTPGTYSVNVVDPLTGCPSLPKTIKIGDCDDCNYITYGPIFPQAPPVTSATWIINEVSSQYGVLPPGPVIIDGTFTVDNNFSILNRPDIYFTKHAKIQLTGNNTLSVIGSTLQGCGLWDGLYANLPAQNITINQSLVKHMSGDVSGALGGVKSTNGAVLNIQNSTFEDNVASINVQNQNGIYSGVIRDNIFKGNTYTGFYNSILNYWGIFIRSAEDLTVGGASASGISNSFENLRSGIWNNSGNANYSIKSVNNRFENIRDLNLPQGIFRDYNVLQNCYLSGWGAAVFSSSTGAGNSNLTTIVENIGQSDPVPMIINCDKAVVTVNSNLMAKRLWIENTLLGIMSTSGSLKYHVSSENRIENSHIGIQAINGISFLISDYNTIQTRNIPVNSPTYPNYRSPLGIDIGYLYSNVLPFLYRYVNNNTIGLNDVAGIGIRYFNGGNNELVADNSISMNTMLLNYNIQNYDLKAIYGLWVEKSQGPAIFENNIWGIPAYQVWNVHNTYGIYMNQSTNCLLHCNNIKFTKYGFHAWGDNSTMPGHVAFNKFVANRYPWYFSDLSSASTGTFGDVGATGMDNGNDFLYNNGGGAINWLNAGQFKVFRNCATAIPHFIYTDPAVLDWFESGAAMGGAEYDVVAEFSGFVDPCQEPFLGIMAQADSNAVVYDTIEYVQATDIAEDSVQYVNYAEVGEWLDEQKLYLKLDVDSILRNSDPTLSNFYYTRQYDRTGYIRKTATLLQALADSGINGAEFDTRKSLALSTNDLIANGEPYEMNVHELNKVQIKLLTLGLDSLQATDQLLVETLAESCPFIEGNAVYTARTLRAMWQPDAKYDDRLICMLGQNKSSITDDIDVDQVLESQHLLMGSSFSNGDSLSNFSASRNILNISPKNIEIVLFPNPANTHVTIKYQCKTKGILILYNAIGQEVIKVMLQPNLDHQNFNLEGLPGGLYTYKCEFEGCGDYAGKLTILKP